MRALSMLTGNSLSLRSEKNVCPLQSLRYCNTRTYNVTGKSERRYIIIIIIRDFNISRKRYCVHTNIRIVCGTKRIIIFKINNVKYDI